MVFPRTSIQYLYPKIFPWSSPVVVGSAPVSPVCLHAGRGLQNCFKLVNRQPGHLRQLGQCKVWVVIVKIANLFIGHIMPQLIGLGSFCGSFGQPVLIVIHAPENQRSPPGFDVGIIGMIDRLYLRGFGRGKQQPNDPPGCAAFPGHRLAQYKQPGQPPYLPIDRHGSNCYPTN